MVFFGRAQSRCFRYGICFGKAALLRIARREFVLRFGNVFGDGGGFVFGQLGVSVIFVMLRFERRGSFVRIERFMAKGCFEFLDMRVRRRHGVYFRSGRHQRRERRETDGIGNRRVVERLSLGFHRFRRKMLMRFHFESDSPGSGSRPEDEEARNGAECAARTLRAPGKIREAARTRSLRAGGLPVRRRSDQSPAIHQHARRDDRIVRAGSCATNDGTTDAEASPGPRSLNFARDSPGSRTEMCPSAVPGSLA